VERSNDLDPADSILPEVDDVTHTLYDLTYGVISRTATFVASYLIYLLIMCIVLDFWDKLKEPTKQFLRTKIEKYVDQRTLSEYIKQLTDRHTGAGQTAGDKNKPTLNRQEEVIEESPNELTGSHTLAERESSDIEELHSETVSEPEVDTLGVEDPVYHEDDVVVPTEEEVDEGEGHWEDVQDSVNEEETQEDVIEDDRRDDVIEENKQEEVKQEDVIEEDKQGLSEVQLKDKQEVSGEDKDEVVTEEDGKLYNEQQVEMFVQDTINRAVQQFQSEEELKAF